jgi:hypothetical protein
VTAPEPTPDPTDYSHRSRVNLIAGIAIVVLIAIVWGTVKLFVDHEKLDACIAEGRRNCIDLDVPPRRGVIVPAR